MHVSMIFCHHYAGKVMFSTVPQEHYFDCPYQLSSEINGQTCLDAKVSTILGFKWRSEKGLHFTCIF